jgi:hypothetical protein
MNKSIEPTDDLLRRTDLPGYASASHRRALRYRVIEAVERRQNMPGRNRMWSIAWIVVVVLGAGAVATTVGVKIYQYRFEGRTSDGAYLFTDQPSSVTSVSSVTIRSNDPNFDPDKARKDLEEVAVLRDREARELLTVVDTTVNGELHRTCIFKYTLADGRTTSMGESEHVEQPPTPEQVRKDKEEIAALRQQGERVLVGIMDIEADGQVFRTCQYRYVLSDGRVQTTGEGPDAELPAPTKVLTPDQLKELYRLKDLGQGESLGILDRQSHGETIACETYRCTLSDGTVATLATGDVKGKRRFLSQADWAELDSLKTSGGGESLGTVEKEVRGRVFVFARMRYVLSDGTEVIYETGEPKKE